MDSAEGMVYTLSAPPPWLVIGLAPVAKKRSTRGAKKRLAQGAKLIAVINDDRPFLALMQGLLGEEGYRVLVLHDHSTAYAAVREAMPDAIILDIRLEHPDSGWHILENLRLDPSLAETPLIVCSADERELQVRAADLRRHKADVLAKPFNLGELLGLLYQLIGPGDAR